MGRRAQLVTRHATAIRTVSVVVLAAGFVLVGRALPLARLLGATDALVERLGAFAPLAYGAAYVAAALLFVPGSALTVAAGALFGLVRGTALVSLASTTAAALAFLVARHLAREHVARLARRHPRFAAVDAAVAEGGWKVVALLRLSPAIPFSAGNYLFGLTAVRFVPYVLASWIAMLPGTFLYVYLGHVGRAGLGAGRDPLEWIGLAVGLAATVLVTVLVARRARRILRARTDVAEPADEREGTAPAAGRVLALAGLALVVGGCGVVATWRPDWLAGLFGPPRIELREAYAARSRGPRFDHSTLDRVLRAHVDAEGRVDYAALARDPSGLDRYLAELAGADLDALGRDELLALLVNAYNAFTLRLVLDHWPVASIRDIPSDRRWEGRTFALGGRRLTLAQIEHEELRAKFVEPRIHFAINCASIGCPPLRPFAYRGEIVDAQLAEQAAFVHARERWARHEPERNVLRLTRIYDWYADDFRQVAGSVPEYAARHVPGLRAALDAGAEPRIEWLEYDWALNAVEPP